MTERPLDLRPLLEQLAALTDAAMLADASLPALRELLPHERRAGVRFVDAARGIDAIAAQTYRRLLTDRGRLLQLVADYARGVQAAHPHARGIDARALLVALSDAHHPLILLPGLLEVIDRSRAFHLAALRDAAALGALHVRAEARHQGHVFRVLQPPAALASPEDPDYRPVAASPPPSNPQLDAELAARAASLAEGPLVDAAVVLRNYALTLPATSWAYGSFIDHVLAAGAASSTKGLETDAARVPAQQSWGLGRQAEAEAIAQASSEPGSVYASELLDGHTCSPCRDIDGTQFENREAGDAAYPAGYYALCRGGPRCRGTLVYVWENESPASV